MRAILETTSPDTYITLVIDPVTHQTIRRCSLEIKLRFPDGRETNKTLKLSYDRTRTDSQVTVDPEVNNFGDSSRINVSLGTRIYDDLDTRTVPGMVSTMVGKGYLRVQVHYNGNQTQR